MTAFQDIRFIFGLIGGAIIAIGLFLFMHWLISGGNQVQTAQTDINLVGFVHVQKQPQVTHKKRIKPPPKPPKKPPKQTQVHTQVSHNTPTRKLPVNVKFNANSLGAGPGVFVNPNSNGPATNGAGGAPLTPMARFRPLYPPQAQVQGVQGTVKTCFTVNPDGTVSNPYVKHASNPQARRMLGEAALKTIRQWKFFPRKKNGKPVPTDNVCQDIVFHIGNQ
jgi:protein TonB